MKKTLMLAVGASQLLLLPQINAANGAGNQEIAVSEGYEVKNGVQGLDRDAFISVAGKVAKGSIPGNGDTKVRRLQGISDETFEHQKHNNFKCEVPQELKNRKELGKQVLQQPVEAIKTPFSRILASNDKNTLIAEDSFGDVFSFSKCSTDGGQTWRGAGIFAAEIKYMNGKFFALRAQKLKDPTGRINADRRDLNTVYTFVSEDGETWTLFLKPGTNIGCIATMAYGNDKYVMITEDGQVLTKTENGKLEKNSTSLTDIIDSCRRDGEFHGEMNSLDGEFDGEMNSDDYTLGEDWDGSFFGGEIGTPEPDDYDYLQDISVGKLHGRSIEIVYAGGVFVLKFEGENKVFICTSIDGISWKLVKVEDFPGFFCFSGIVGGPLGFVYKGEGSRLYYSPSGNDWAEVTLPEWPGGEVDHTSEGFARVLYVASSFYGDMFIALPYRGEYALLGTQGKEGITWSWINLNISFSGMPVGSQNIRYISCVGKKIIIDGQKTEDQGQDLGFRAQL